MFNLLVFFFFNLFQDNLTFFYFIFQNSNVLVISRFQWLILVEEQIT